ncbi:MAG: phosphatidylglycerophosphatase A [Bordetella sp.]|nr:MAG: phosphatidylglycerophosphatase A [Bordetella sp.]
MHHRYDIVFPTLSWILKNPNRFLAFGFGIGLIRYASGTFGTILAWLIWFLIRSNLTNLNISIFLIFSFLYGCWICNQVSVSLGNKDHVGIVFDEIVSFWFILWSVPENLIIQFISFLLFRFFDSVKPGPIKFFEKKLQGGIGIMMDDFIAAILTIFIVNSTLVINGSLFFIK